MSPCKKCPYFNEKISLEVKTASNGPAIAGFCKLRQLYVDRVTIKNEFCKDKAVRSLKSIPKPKKDPVRPYKEQGIITF